MPNKIKTPPLNVKKLEEMFNIIASDSVKILDVTAGTDYPVTLRLTPDQVHDITTNFNKQ